MDLVTSFNATKHEYLKLLDTVKNVPKGLWSYYGKGPDAVVQSPSLTSYMSHEDGTCEWGLV